MGGTRGARGRGVESVAVGRTRDARRSERRSEGSSQALDLGGLIRAGIALGARTTGDGRRGGTVLDVSCRTLVASSRRGLPRERQRKVCAVGDGVLIRAESVRRAQGTQGSNADVAVVADTQTVVDHGVGRTDAVAQTGRPGRRHARGRAGGNDTTLAITVSGAVLACDVIGGKLTVVTG